MAGLLDFLNTDDGKLGVALLSAAGPSMQPMSFGQRLSGAMQSLDADKLGQMKLGLLRSQMEENDAQTAARKAAMADQQLAAQTAARFFTPGKPAMGGLDSSLPPQFQTGVVPQAGAAPKFDLQGYAQARMGQNPLEGMKLLAELQKEKPINKLDVKDFTPASVQKFAQTGNYSDLERMDKLHFADTGGSVAGLNPFTGQPVSTSPKTGNPFSDLVVSDGQGGVRLNQPLIGAKQSIAKAGATNISVNTEKSLLNDLAGGLGKSLVGARDGAQSALNTIGTVNRLMDALDTNKVMAGPGTTFRQYGLQVGNLLGVSGKDANEKMLNTRQAIQSLAQLELDAAQQMKGQGQITEAERAIIRRAASGDIEGMTTGELRLLGGVLDRTARSKIQNYNRQVKPLASNPNAAPIAPFLNVEEPAARQAPNVLRFDAQGNPVN